MTVNREVIMPLAPIQHLPPDLIDYVLSFVPPEELQRTALSLLKVFPDYPLAPSHLWKHVVVHRKQQLLPLWTRLKSERQKDDGDMSKATRSFHMKSWRGDADILNNALRCLPDIDALSLNIGTNFAPEHLEELFEDPRPSLRKLEMRFRPYVEQASYYQFLAGSYFDTAVETMYRNWPDSSLFTHLSIVQDLPPRQVTPGDHDDTDQDVHAANSSLSHLALGVKTQSDPAKIQGYTGHGPFPYLSGKMADAKPKTFAQPIVFFDIKCLARFGSSPAAENLTHLRLRVPSRDIASVLAAPIGSPSTLFPSLRYLDISTTNVRLDSTLAILMRSYPELEYLVLDRVNLFGFTARDRGAELCRELGSMCLSACLARGKEFQRKIEAWDLSKRMEEAVAEEERRRLTSNEDEENQEESSSDDHGPSSSRTDPADSNTPAIELEIQAAAARSRRGHRSAAHSTFSLRDRPRNRRFAATSAGSTVAPGIVPAAPHRAYFVLPPLPTLKSICIGGEAHRVDPAMLEDWHDSFHQGWHQGLKRLFEWAQHTVERYERARRKAGEWLTRDANHKGKVSSGKGKGQATSNIPPPLDVRLFRFSLPSEKPRTEEDEDPTACLIQIHGDEEDPLSPYQLAIDGIQAFLAGEVLRPPCTLCTVPDCEGPSRRTAEGDTVDERGGMDEDHRNGCGHLVGRAVWGQMTDT